MVLIFQQQHFATAVAIFLWLYFHSCFAAVDVASGVHDDATSLNDVAMQRQLQTLGQVDRFILINADTNLPIIDLVDGMIINIATQSTSNFSIQTTITTANSVDTTTTTVGSIKYGYNTRPGFRIELNEPYAFCGDGRPVGNYFPCTNLIVGQHNVTATTFTGNRANGTQGMTKKLSFRIVNTPPTAAPTIAPTAAPTIAPTAAPTALPTSTPSSHPSKAPSNEPSSHPSATPSNEPSNAPSKHPTTSAPISICNVPQFLDPVWTAFTPVIPNKTSEPMGLLIGNDFVSFSGFTNNFAGTTNQTLARDMTVAGSPWRLMDDMPLAISFTHAPTVKIGMKVYMCGGYLGGHPGPHVAYCFVYDHSIPPGTGQQWTRFTDLPNSGYAGGGMIYDTLRDSLYFAGGGQRLNPGSPHPVDFNHTFKYSFQNTAAGWVEIAPIPYLANHISSVTQTYLGQERHYFVGGQKGENERYQNLAELYEFIASNETWVPRTFMPFPRGHTTASTHPIGCGFIMAGGAVNTVTTIKNRTKSVIYYDIPTDSWTLVAGELTGAHATPLVDIHSNGYMYFVSNKATERRRFAA